MSVNFQKKIVFKTILHLVLHSVQCSIKKVHQAIFILGIVSYGEASFPVRISNISTVQFNNNNSGIIQACLKPDWKPKLQTEKIDL